jgi:putative restriction endonuclease
VTAEWHSFAVNQSEADVAVRTAAFAFLIEQRQVHGEQLPWSTLTKGFRFAGQRVPLVGPQGIFKPAILPEMPLSITTAPIVEGKPRPYEDEQRDDGFIVYRYRGNNPNHRDNVGLRLAMERHAPLVYFSGVAVGWYFPIFPAYVVGEDRRNLAFFVQADEGLELSIATATIADDAGRRRYVTRLVQRRLHQEEFRVRVIRAYRVNCSVCGLHGHAELLDAAHILPDGHPQGKPVLPNGLSLCKFHHPAFDTNVIGIRPDYSVEVRRDVLREIDGPMLKYGLQGMDRRQLVVPLRQEQRPDPNFLEERYEAFRKVG